MTNTGDQEKVPYAERSIPEILSILRSRLGDNADSIIKYALTADDDVDTPKINDYANGNADPDEDHDKRLRTVVKLIETTDRGHLSGVGVYTMLFVGKRALDGECPINAIHDGNSDLVNQALPQFGEQVGN
jgi:hypothetical protein